MKKSIFALVLLLAAYTINAQTTSTQKIFEKDSFDTPKGQLVITFIGHATLMLQAGKTIIHVDPVFRETEYVAFPKGDIILITHDHDDHLDKNAIEHLTQPNTITIISQSCSNKLRGGLVLKNGDEKSIGEISIKAVPAYNIVQARNGIPYHPKGDGNGYVITFGGKKIYIAGDTENIPELANLKGIDIAFLPMNLPFTMTPEMMASGARSFMPKILYPYHYGNTNPQLLIDLLKNSNIDVRFRKMK